MATLYTTAMLHAMAMIHTMSSEIHERAAPRENEFESLLADLFRRAGWLVREQYPSDSGAALIVDSNENKYIVQLKRSPEARRDRLVPLLSQAILEAKAAARHFSQSVIPVAVVASQQIPDSVAKQVKQFALN